MTLPVIIGLLGFGGTTVAYAVLAALVLGASPKAKQARWFALALLASSIWGLGGLFGLWANPLVPVWSPLLDAIRIAAIVLFFAVLLTNSTSGKSGARIGRTIMIAATMLLAIVFLAHVPPIIFDDRIVAPQMAMLPMIGLPILALLTLEQVFRNAQLRERAFLRPLSIAYGTVFAVDLFAYSEAMLFSVSAPSVWLLRGLANLLVTPSLLVAIKRQPGLNEQLLVSRQAVFYTTGLIGAGMYLFAMGMGGFILGSGEDAWGTSVQILFLVCTGAVFLYALFSADVRRNFKVFISKHFFRDRYDYRAEWLRLTRALAAHDDDTSLAERSLDALTSIISSSGGELWLSRAPREGFDRRATTSESTLPDFVPDDDEMAQFLRQTFWVVDTPEYNTDPEKYANAFELESRWMHTPSIVVPLMHERRLVGIARLARPALLGSLDFKDHDLLKIAGQQIAVFLAQERTQEQLSETLQLEAFSKLTTFLMHDLKNLIAQQELVVGNARRFRHRPEFIDDAFDTIDRSVTRMRRLLDRLQGVTEREYTTRIELRKLIGETCRNCADREPRPRLSGDTDAVVSMDREKLNMIITHAIRNSQDATPSNGRIDVRVSAADAFARIEVEDTGVGMSAEFIRDVLFKPFSSTKGVQGMGIGAYQIRETLRAAGGDVQVLSEVGRGTILQMRIPLATGAPAAPDLKSAETAATAMRQTS